MGGGGTSTTSFPPPVDYSAAMTMQSDNMKTVAMGQIMAQQFAMQQASMDRQMQTAANLEMGLERLDTKLQVAKLNYLQFMQEEENRHTEKMTEIGGEIDAARAGDGSDTQVTSDFLSNDGGSYKPGDIWDGASKEANDNRVDFGEKWDTLLQNDKEQTAQQPGILQDHNKTEIQKNKDYQDSQPYGDSDGDGTPNINEFDYEE